MKWTHERPTKIGKYWYRHKSKLMRCIVDIWTPKGSNGALFTNQDGGASLMDSYFDDGLWSDAPIPEPDGGVMIKKLSWCVRFRYIPPYMQHAPLPPIEDMLIYADSANEAWTKFLSNIPLELQIYYIKEEIYLAEK